VCSCARAPGRSRCWSASSIWACASASTISATGYSSLGYLSRNALLVDQDRPQFRAGRIEGEKEAIAIIRAVVALAQSLAWRPPRKAWRPNRSNHMVQDLGCTKVQGYYFGRPLPVEEARSIAQRDLGDGSSAVAA